MAPARAALAQQVAQAQQAQLAAVASRLPAAAVTQMKQRIELRARGDVPQQIIVPGGGATTALAGGVVRRAPVIATQSQAASGATPVGTSGGAAVAVAPTITNLSVRQGSPGTPVLLEGSAFGDQPGEVRFLVANGTDLPAPASYWSNTQVFAEVPVKEGVQAFDGYVYVKRADGSKTALVPFGFQPTSDIVTFCVGNNAGDVRIGNPVNVYDGQAFSTVYHSTFFAGFAGYDEYNLQQRLTNGWRTMAAELRNADQCNKTGASRSGASGSGAYIVDWRPGTDSPYVKVRWWLDPVFFDYNAVSYTLAITVTGPKGLAFR